MTGTLTRPPLLPDAEYLPQTTLGEPTARGRQLPGDQLLQRPAKLADLTSAREVKRQLVAPSSQASDSRALDTRLSCAR